MFLSECKLSCYTLFIKIFEVLPLFFVHINKEGVLRNTSYKGI